MHTPQYFDVHSHVNDSKYDDDRDEVLHKLERAGTDRERQTAAEAFLAWAEELDLLLAPPETARRD